MKNSEEFLKHIDQGEQSLCRIKAISQLLMSCGDQDLPSAEEFRTVAHLIYEETQKLQSSLQVLTDSSETR